VRIVVSGSSAHIYFTHRRKSPCTYKAPTPPLSRPHILVGWVVRDDGAHVQSACSAIDPKILPAAALDRMYVVTPPLSRPHILVGWVVRDDGAAHACSAIARAPQNPPLIACMRTPTPPLSRPHILVGWVVRDDGAQIHEPRKRITSRCHSTW